MTDTSLTPRDRRYQRLIGACTPRRRRQRRRLGLGTALLCLMIMGVLTIVAANTGSPPTGVMAAVPYWNFSDGGAAVVAHRKTFDTVSPWLYGIEPDGQVVPQSPEAVHAAESLHRSGQRYVPTIANARNGTFEYGPVSQVLHDPAVRARHVRSVVQLAVSQHTDGIDLDYEDLHGSDRDAFTALVQELAKALHAHGKTLSVDLFAKASDAGYDQRNVAQDYAAIGRVVDKVRLMTYDYHWSSSAPGPLAPIGWVRDVLRYARSQIPPGKLVLGLDLSGYDWVGKHGTDCGLGKIEEVARDRDATIHWDGKSQSPWYSYVDDKGRRHEVWFENARSITAKINLADHSDLGGVFVWLNKGSADPAIWNTLHQMPSLPGARGDR